MKKRRKTKVVCGRIDPRDWSLVRAFWKKQGVPDASSSEILSRTVAWLATMARTAGIEPDPEPDPLWDLDVDTKALTEEIEDDDRDD